MRHAVVLRRMAQGAPGAARQASRVLLAKEKIFTKEAARPAQRCAAAGESGKELCFQWPGRYEIARRAFR